jgi:hypothetical protein
MSSPSQAAQTKIEMDAMTDNNVHEFENKSVRPIFQAQERNPRFTAQTLLRRFSWPR